MCFALASCAELPSSLVDDDLLLDGDGDASLIIDLGENAAVASDQAVETVAQVLNGEQGELFYRWEYALLDNATATSGSDAFEIAQAEDYVKDWAAISFIPRDLFPGMDIRGKILRVRVNVIEVAEFTREGVGDRFLSITTGDPDGGDEDSIVIDEGIFEEDLDPTDNDNDNANDSLPHDPNDDGNSNDNGSPDPCEGVTALTVTLTSPLSMSLFEGSINLDPAVCGGTAPYVYGRLAHAARGSRLDSRAAAMD